MAEETKMTNIEIQDFLPVSGVKSSDFIVVSQFEGTSAKIAVGVFQSALVSSINPSIRDGYWWIGETNQEVMAEGLTPEFRKTTLGIEWKYTVDSSWKLLVPMNDILFKFDDLTDAQRELITLKYSDLTESEISELQKPARDMIAVLETTNSEVSTAEKLRIEAESKRSEAELVREGNEEARMSAEEERITAETVRTENEEVRKSSETSRVSAESDRKYSESVRESNEAVRVSQETVRVNGEKDRVAAEKARVSAENDRVSEFTRLKSESESATAAANDTADHPTYIGEDNYVYKWNKAARTYDKTSIYVRGEAFSIKKVYTSIDAMYGDTSTPFREGDFCLINTGSVEDPENAQLFVRTSVGGWDFLVDMSGAVGFTGKVPQLFIGTVDVGSGKGSAAVTLTPGGTDTDGNPMYNLNYIIPCLAYEDLTEEQIGELQRPASEMIAKLAETDKAVKEAEDIRKEAEDRRVSAEESRASAESGRNESEEERLRNEESRVDAEEARSYSEKERVETENIRIESEEERVSAENIRKANEATRENNEQVRVAAENLRSTAEQERISSEAARKESENARASSESERVSNEEIREQNEESRKDNETVRQSNETSRQETDSLRKEDYSVLREDAVAATDAANSAALKARNLPKIQNGTWWLFDIEQGVYVDTGYSVGADYQLTREKIEGVFKGNVDSHWHDRYVDKVEGKQLSAEDFTTLLKEKLEGLENYDDTEVSGAISKLRSDFDTLVSGNTDSAIESFNEVVSFLEGLNDTQNLSGIIASIQGEIAKKADAASLPTKLSQFENDVPFATSAELSSGLLLKQDIISDLTDIRNGAALGSTALQTVPDEYVTDQELEEKGYATTNNLTDGLKSKQDANLYFTNMEASVWVLDGIYEDYKYRCDIVCEGVTADMFPEVVFSVDDSSSGDYAPVSETGDGIVSIWSDTNKTIVVPTIVISK